MGWKSESTLPYGFRDGDAVVYNNKIHILGADDGPTNHYSWDGTTWASESTLPYIFRMGSAVVFNNKIHILGGFYSTYHYSWDGTTWVSESTLPYNFEAGSAVVFNNKIHILGGDYEPTNHYSWDGTSWTEESTLPFNYYDGKAVVYDNEIHIFYNNTDHYSWDGTSWTEETVAPFDVDLGTKAVSYDNRLHILGGYYSEASELHYSFRNTLTNKVIFGTDVLIDLTSDTVTPGDVLLDVTFHDATGEQKVGTYEPPSVTDITPSDSSPVALEANKRYKALAAGYAIESNPSTVTPSDSSPASLTSGSIVKIGSGGYAIESNPVSVTPTAAGEAFNAGINNMSTGGYAYSQRPAETETDLWTNADPSAAFDVQDITLSQAYTNFNKLRFYFVYRNTLLTPETWVEYDVSDIVDNWRSGSGAAGTNILKKEGSFSLVVNSQNYFRFFTKDADNPTTKFHFWRAYRLSDAASSTAYLIPTKITGVNYG